MFNASANKEAEVIQLGRNILRESDLEIPIQYNGEQFVLRYPTPAIQAAIESEIARRLNGFPRASFAPEHIASVEAYVIVDFTFIAEKCPKWFKGPWTCYDDECIATLYKGYFLFRDQFREKLRSGGFETGTEQERP